MNKRNGILSMILGGSLAVAPAHATERYFGYSYEPETMPKGAWEIEQWLTSRTGRDGVTGQSGFQEWDIRHSIEYGVTDNYTVEFYVNEDVMSFHDPMMSATSRSVNFDGFSLENRYMVLNPADHAVGLTLYVEPRFSDTDGEVEEKIILGQRQGDWKWALNLTHSSVWSHDYRGLGGEVEGSFGLGCDLNKHWAIGVEARDFNELPDYHNLENTTVYAGPVVSYRRTNWWATLSVMPQIYGRNFSGAAEGSGHLELIDNERLDVRLIFGIQF